MHKAKMAGYILLLSILLAINSVNEIRCEAISCQHFFFFFFFYRQIMLFMSHG